MKESLAIPIFFAILAVPGAIVFKYVRGQDLDLLTSLAIGAAAITLTVVLLICAFTYAINSGLGD